METNRGTITLELDDGKAPATVGNFIKYAKSGFYDGTIFHRVIDGFMIQGGGFTKDMNQKPTDAPIMNEAMNGLKNLRGTIAMARTAVVDSATSQFFINLVDNPFLDFVSPDPRNFGYAVFLYGNRQSRFFRRNNPAMELHRGTVREKPRAMYHCGRVSMTVEKITRSMGTATAGTAT